MRAFLRWFREGAATAAVWCWVCSSPGADEASVADTPASPPLAGVDAPTLLLSRHAVGTVKSAGESQILA